MSTSRDNDEVRRLFGDHVPEIASGAVEIVGIARETGRRVMIAVHAPDAGVCPVGSCVGPRGERVKTVMRSLPGDKIDIVRWSDSEEDFIRNLLAPAKVEQITFDATAHRATVTVRADSTSRLTEDGGIRLRLASRLAGWDLRLIET
jgi:N utilization substance protein A